MMNQQSTIEICSEKLLKDPFNVPALTSRALAFLRMGSLDSSFADYESVLSIDAENVDALFYSGLILEKRQCIDEAIERFTKVLEIDPGHIKASYARGACQNVKGEFAKAIDDYTIALERDTQRRNYRKTVCELDDQTTRRPVVESGVFKDTNTLDNDDEIWEELEQLTKKLKHDRENVDLRTRRAKLLVKIGQFDAAINDYSEALERSPYDSSLYLNRGILHDEIEQFDRAIADYTSGILLSVEPSADLYTNRGFSHRKKGDLKAAMDDYNTAIRIDHDHDIAQVNRGILKSLMTKTN